jgi:hypothetical protein
VIPDPSPPFEFELSGAMRERLEHLLAGAAERGVLQDAATALAEILRRLANTPRKWGDPIQNLRHANLTVYRGMHWELRCQYAVHNRVPIVFLTEILPLERNPLFGL